MSKVTDMTFLSSFTGGDNLKMKKYIEIYLQHAPNQVSKLESNLAERNWAGLRIAAHSLKPQLSYMGIKRLENSIKDLEMWAGEEQNLEVIPTLVADVVQVCRQSFIELQQQVDEIK